MGFLSLNQCSYELGKDDDRLGTLIVYYMLFQTRLATFRVLWLDHRVNFFLKRHSQPKFKMIIYI